MPHWIVFEEPFKFYLNDSKITFHEGKYVDWCSDRIFDLYIENNIVELSVCKTFELTFELAKSDTFYLEFQGILDGYWGEHGDGEHFCISFSKGEWTLDAIDDEMLS